MNYDVLRSWFAQSPELFLSCLILVIIGLLSSVFWLFFALSKFTLDFKLTFAGALLAIMGLAVVGHRSNQALEYFGLSTTVITCLIVIMYWFIKWMKWANRW
jgi:Flp pilus assembly protein TadB